MFTNQYPKSYQRQPASFGPRQMVAKFAGVCRTCRQPIQVGEAILYSRDAGAVHLACPATPAVVNATPAPARLAVEDAGVYVLPDGAVVKVQANKDKTRTYAKRLVEIGG